MADTLYHIDVAIFYFINHTLSNPFFDKFFPFITDVKNWYIAYIILWFVVFFKGGRLGKIAAILSIFLITASDQFSSAFLKNLIERVRPCNVLPDVYLRAVCTGSYSFPSSHAVNNFAVAVFFYRLFPKYKWLLLSIATVIALSRPYVGVHYPSDIVGGALIGAAFGYLFSVAALQIDSFIKKRNEKNGSTDDEIVFR